MDEKVYEGFYVFAVGQCCILDISLARSLEANTTGRGLEEAAFSASPSLTARLTRVSRPRSLTLAGSFSGLPILAASYAPSGSLSPGKDPGLFLRTVHAILCVLSSACLAGLMFIHEK